MSKKMTLQEISQEAKSIKDLTVRNSIKWNKDQLQDGMIEIDIRIGVLRQYFQDKKEAVFNPYYNTAIKWLYDSRSILNRQLRPGFKKPAYHN